MHPEVVTAADAVAATASDAPAGARVPVDVRRTVDPIDFVDCGPDEDSLDAFAATVDSETLHCGDCDVASPCGAIGWLSYDIARALETLPDSVERDRDGQRLLTEPIAGTRPRGANEAEDHSLRMTVGGDAATAGDSA